MLQITVGSIVTRSPASMVSATAFIELGLAVDLFEGASMSTRRARSALVSHSSSIQNLGVLIRTCLRLSYGNCDNEHTPSTQNIIGAVLYHTLILRSMRMTSSRYMGVRLASS